MEHVSHGAVSLHIMLVVATPYPRSCSPRHCDCADDECCNLRFTSESKDDDSGGVVLANLRVGVLSRVAESPATTALVRLRT